MPNTIVDESLIAAIREAFDAVGSAQKSVFVAKWMNRQYANKNEPYKDTWNANYVGSYIRRCSVNMPGAISRHPGFPRFLFCRGRGEFEIYDSNSHGSYDERGYLAGEPSEDSGIVEDVRQITEELQSKTEFAYEAHLRDYLARNLGLLESGLTLWGGSDVESVEYSLGGRRIDILGKDKDGIPVVIELKLSKGHERTVGQALYYRAKLKQLLSVSRVRIILVAAEITDELKMAASEVTDVDLFQYSLTMQLDRVKD